MMCLRRKWGLLFNLSFMLVHIVILKSLPFIYTEAIFYMVLLDKKKKNCFLFFEKPECSSLTCSG